MIKNTLYNCMQKAAGKTWRNVWTALPIVVGILLLISLINPILSEWYPKVFTGNHLLDPILGALAGSVMFGIPITGYVAGGELLASGVSLLAVTAFIMAWTTVGVAMLPLEISVFGKRFALARNGINFVTSIIIAVLTVMTLNIWR